ncbi:MAG: TonB-dependent receptor [Gammaproteobacteria bacterium]|nr:TonB-dependent receptor [Gammaproteobacteria bacterium]
MFKLSVRAVAYAVGVAVAPWPVITTAQEGQAARGALEEVVVTARRREESLQEVPVAISAFGDAELESRGVDELGQLNAVAPNVSLRGGMATAASQGSFRVRGVPGVATYVDGVWQSTTDGMYTLGVVEVDRIEVLRGPQGTLFGKNAVGGAIQYVTRLPGEEFGARVDVTTGSFSRRDTTIAVDLPLSDTLKTKVTAASLYRDGFVDSLSVNRSWGDVNDDILRADVLWEPTEKFTARFIAERSEVDRWGPARVLLSMGDPVYDPVTDTNSNPRAQAYANIGMPISNLTHSAGWPGGEVGEYQNKSTWEGRGLRVDLDRYTLDLNWYMTDALQLRSITGYREHYRTAQTDFDAMEINFIERDFRGAGEQWTQELQLIGEYERFSWVGGLFLWDDRSDGRTWTWVSPEFRDPAVRAQAIAGGMGVPASFGVPPGTLDSLSRTDTEGWAVFADGTFLLTDRLSLSLGVRQQDEDLTTGALIPTIDAPELPGSDPAGDDFGNAGWANQFTDSFDSFTWRGTLQYQFTPEVMGYVGYSEGFSAGGISVPNLPQYPDIPTQIPYDPETLENFEIGLRADWLDGLMRTNITLFDGSYDDIQVTNYLFTRCYESTACDGPLTQIPNLHLTNAAKADVTGVELESVFYPSDDWMINLNVGFLDTEYTEVGEAADAIRPGAPFAQAPEWTVSTSIQYNHTLPGGGLLTPRVDYTWSDEYTLATDYRNQNFQASFGLLNARVTYTPPSGRWEFAAFGSNLTDEYYMDSGFYSEANQISFVSLGRPREYGASLSFSFE